MAEYRQNSLDLANYFPEGKVKDYLFRIVERQKQQQSDLAQKMGIDEETLELVMQMAMATTATPKFKEVIRRPNVLLRQASPKSLRGTFPSDIRIDTALRNLKNLLKTKKVR